MSLCNSARTGQEVTMAFYKAAFLVKFDGLGRNGPAVLADELHALHAEIDVLKARLPEPKPGRA